MSIVITPNRIPVVICSIVIAISFLFYLDLVSLPPLARVPRPNFFSDDTAAATTYSTFTKHKYPPTTSDIQGTPQEAPTPIPSSQSGDPVRTEGATRCPPNPKPNLILSAIDGAKWQDAIFKFMQSLEASLGREAMEARRAKECPPSPVLVKIIVPEDVEQDIGPSFTALTRRYPHLQFVGLLPDLNVGTVLKRFLGWADLLDATSSHYDRILATDLDVVFQRNPFSMPLKPDIEMLDFKEWRGLKIGQCRVHQGWFGGCLNSPGAINGTTYMDQSQVEQYRNENIICAGSVYGTARAIRVYMRLMATHLHESEFRCNDQAMHIHLYYSGILDEKLRAEGFGGVYAMTNEESLLGTIGLTPMTTFNEWGEILNEFGEVQTVIHQYKSHPLLVDIVNRRYSWMADPGVSTKPSVAALVEDEHWTAEKVTELESAEKDSAMDPEQLRAKVQTQYLLKDMKRDDCKQYDSLCSCNEEDCQFNYGGHRP